MLTTFSQLTVAERAAEGALPEHRVVLHQLEVDVGLGRVLVICRPVVRLQDVEAGRADHVVELLLDEADELVEAGVVLAQKVRERLQQLRPELADRVAQRVVREQVAEERHLEAEDLALDQVLDRREDLVEAVDDDARVGEECEQARQLRAEALPRVLARRAVVHHEAERVAADRAATRSKVTATCRFGVEAPFVGSRIGSLIASLKLSVPM